MSLISGLVNQEITTVASVASDEYGDVTETTVYSNISCRWQEKRQIVKSESNEEILSTVEVWLLPNYTSVREKQRVTFGSEKYVIVGKENKFDLGGNLDHIKIFLV